MCMQNIEKNLLAAKNAFPCECQRRNASSWGLSLEAPSPALVLCSLDKPPVIETSNSRGSNLLCVLPLANEVCLSTTGGRQKGPQALGRVSSNERSQKKVAVWGSNHQPCPGLAPGS